MSFSSNLLSFDSLNVLTRWGFRPRAAHTRCTVAGLTPCALAIVRQLQCVSPGGFSCSVASTMAVTFSSGIAVLRPRPGFTFPNFFNPSSANRARQDVTLVGDTPSSHAIAVLASPRAASSSALARVTSRWAAVCDLASFSRISRWPLVIVSGAVAGRMRHSTRITTYMRDTTLGSRALGHPRPSEPPTNGSRCDQAAEGFLLRGNLLDLAVAVAIGAGFTG